MGQEIRNECRKQMDVGAGDRVDYLAYIQLAGI